MNKIAYSIVIVLFIASCTYDKNTSSTQPTGSGYPAAVANIIVNKCATSGCHDDISKDGASGLSLSTWDRMLEGNNSGPVVIPYRTDLSTTLFFTNSYPEDGISLTPKMPINASQLTRAEIKILNDWIMIGAPNANGFVKFSDNPDRKKVYVTNQGCDVVYVFDQQTGIIMRVINVGASISAIDSPHMVKVSPDGQYWYVVFYNSPYVQKYRTSDDSFVGQVNIGDGLWNTIVISDDSKIGYVVNWTGNGSIARINLETMTKTTTYGGGTGSYYVYPHGIAINKAQTVLYVSGQTGNYIYKIDISDPTSDDPKKISLQPGIAPTTVSSLDSHEIILSPDESEYYVTCQKSNEVRVMQTSNDSLLKIIPVGILPQELALSKKSGYIFVSCTEDSLTVPANTKGSVAVIDYKTNSLVKIVYGFFQPHGIAVDEDRQLVYVASRNASPKGPAPHHTTSCGGRNGFVQTIDIKTLQLSPKYRIEVSTDPYSIAVKE